MKVKFKKLHPDAVIPKYGKPGDAGMDLTAVLSEGIYDSIHDSNTKIMVDSGISVEIPEGYVGLVFTRSSIQSTGVRSTNCVGVIDSGYRGSIKAYFDFIDISLKYYDKGDRK